MRLIYIISFFFIIVFKFEYSISAKEIWLLDEDLSVIKCWFNIAYLLLDELLLLLQTWLLSILYLFVKIIAGSLIGTTILFFGCCKTKL